MVEQEAVNFKVRGSNPRGGALRFALLHSVQAERNEDFVRMRSSP